MSRTNLRIHLLTVACLTSTCFAVADEPLSNPSRVKPPKITLVEVARANFGDQQLFSLTLEVANPNDASLSYTGYTADSFDPPLAAGHIVPLCHIELKRDGKWQPDPRGYCGFGLADLELTAKGSATFAVTLPADDWQAVKVAIGHYPGWSNGEASTTTTWSTEITREAIGVAVDKPASQTVPESGLPVGKWSVEFAGGSSEACEICADGTASVSEPQRSSTGKAKLQDGDLLLVFNDDRTERWTAIGKRFVVEHWFPASQFPSVAPVLGIAERRDSQSRPSNVQCRVVAPATALPPLPQRFRLHTLPQAADRPRQLRASGRHRPGCTDAGRRPTSSAKSAGCWRDVAAQACR